MSEQNDQIILAALAAAGPIVPLSKEEEKRRKGLAKMSESERAEAIKKDGPVRDPQIDWDQGVKSIARNIKTMLRPDSELNRQLKALDKCFDPDNKDGKSFMATIVRTYKDEPRNGKPSSTRAVVVMHTGTKMTFDGLPAGFEITRTDRTDNPDGLAIAKLAQGLVGHKVIAYIDIQQMSSGKNARTAVHFEDLGVDPNYQKLRKKLS